MQFESKTPTENDHEIDRKKHLRGAVVTLSIFFKNLHNYSCKTSKKFSTRQIVKKLETIKAMLNQLSIIMDIMRPREKTYSLSFIDRSLISSSSFKYLLLYNLQL